MSENELKRPFKVIHNEFELWEYLANPWAFNYRIIFSKEMIKKSQFKLPKGEIEK